MRILLDVNVVLDVILAREPWLAASLGVIRACGDGRCEASVTATTVTTLFYITERNTDYDRAKAAVAQALQSFAICPVDQVVLSQALLMSGVDFEDDVQTACAMRDGLEIIVTRDKMGFRKAPLQVMTPDELLAHLAA